MQPSRCGLFVREGGTWSRRTIAWVRAGVRIRTRTQQRCSPLLPSLQVTALGQPKLLERVSDSLNAVHNLFRRFDEDLNGVVTRDEFEKVSFAMAFTAFAPNCCAYRGQHLLQMGRAPLCVACCTNMQCRHPCC